MAEENLRTALAPSNRCMALSDRSFVSAGSFTSFMSAVSVTGTEGSPTVSEASLHTAVRSESITEQDPLVDAQAVPVQAPVRVDIDHEPANAANDAEQRLRQRKLLIKLILQVLLFQGTVVSVDAAIAVWGHLYNIWSYQDAYFLMAVNSIPFVAVLTMFTPCALAGCSYTTVAELIGNVQLIFIIWLGVAPILLATLDLVAYQQLLVTMCFVHGIACIFGLDAVAGFCAEIRARA